MGRIPNLGILPRNNVVIFVDASTPVGSFIFRGDHEPDFGRFEEQDQPTKNTLPSEVASLVAEIFERLQPLSGGYKTFHIVISPVGDKKLTATIKVAGTEEMLQEVDRLNLEYETAKRATALSTDA